PPRSPPPARRRGLGRCWQCDHLSIAASSTPTPAPSPCPARSAQSWEDTPVGPAVVQPQAQQGEAPVGGGISFNEREQGGGQRDGELGRVAAAGPAGLPALPRHPHDAEEPLYRVAAEDPFNSHRCLRAWG